LEFIPETDRNRFGICDLELGISTKPERNKR